MANIVILGIQWGDEGKGKIVDLFAPAFGVVCRYQGGHNAGHTVHDRGRKIVLHLVPSGILHPGTLCLIGNGVVLDPKAFLDEVADLKSAAEIRAENIAISSKAHLILPYHRLIEKDQEERLGAKRIGTTCRGIGPAYEDKAGRRGIRAGDLLDPDILRDKIERNCAEKNLLFAGRGIPAVDPAAIYEEYAGYAEALRPFIRDLTPLLTEAVAAGRPILFEGAQGTLLDVDHGTYPFVTSSNATAGGVCTGLGIGPTAIDEVLGVAKAYTTRVGSGPFPTELADATGKCIAERGDEFGATTGRPRRCGWFDAVAVAYACRVNGIKKIVMTKPDVLDGLLEIRVCTEYRYKGRPLREFPTEPWILEKVVPEYRSVRGWALPVHGIRDFGALPAEFRDYLRVIEDLVEAEVAIVSTGVEREETVFLEAKLDGIVDVASLQSRPGRRT